MIKTILGSWLVIFLLVTAITDASFAQSFKLEPPFDYLYRTIQTKNDRNKEVEFELNRNYLRGYISDIKNILTSQLRWRRSDWINAILIVGTTVGLYTYDQDIQNWVQKNRNSTSDKIAKFTKPFGDGKYTLPPLSLLYLYGHFFEYEKVRKVALLSLESFIISGIFTEIIKYTGHRHRPNTGEPHNTWDGPGFSTSHLSFPSGHSSSAFAIATVIASEYDDRVFIPPLVYGIAVLTALSRVNENAHWASDVFFGSAVGYFTAKAIVGLHSNEKKDRNAVIIPVINDKHTALLISYKF